MKDFHSSGVCLLYSDAPKFAAVQDQKIELFGNEETAIKRATKLIDNPRCHGLCIVADLGDDSCRILWDVHQLRGLRSPACENEEIVC